MLANASEWGDKIDTCEAEGNKEEGESSPRLKALEPAWRWKLNGGCTLLLRIQLWPPTPHKTLFKNVGGVHLNYKENILKIIQNLKNKIDRVNKMEAYVPLDKD